MAIQPILKMGHPNLRSQAADYPLTKLGATLSLLSSRT